MTEDLLNLKKYISVVHHVDGRIRLKVNPAIMKDPLSKKLGEISGSLPGVLDKRINMMAKSVVLRYDPSVVPPQDMQALLGSPDIEVSKKILDKYKDLIK
ncbi:conserved hypothetical protein [Denitrovibrio acetiphilus DSM 12809]|uniref:Uncharacterized protein n=1 Tax=Denitrovibrio acetiphilus (strain DSM 12809 / NBRC 114555 / N2460) TaxID=522772 RepID=D4H2A7_DENA2|nr:hypothetical protein [Denitrovibrio acetiphilus]ADD68898.1 conserved hypothetical protein [Denitrovibrio acetiphilus DSM 12809]